MVSSLPTSKHYQFFNHIKEVFEKVVWCCTALLLYRKAPDVCVCVRVCMRVRARVSAHMCVRVCVCVRVCACMLISSDPRWTEIFIIL